MSQSNEPEEPAPSGSRALQIVGRRLSSILNRLSGDRLFDGLVALATGDVVSMGIPVGLIVNGVQLEGVLGSDQEMAEALDDHLVKLTRVANYRFTVPPKSAEEVETYRVALAETFSRVFQSQVEEQREFSKQTQQELATAWGPADTWGIDKPTTDDLPDQLARRAIQYLAPPEAVTLTRARLLVPGGNWQHVDRLRVALRSVSAWWLLAPQLEERPTAGPGAFAMTFEREDQEFESRFDFLQTNVVELKIRPTGNSPYWRLGFEFSDGPAFSGWRYGPSHPLLHLTKNEHGNVLQVDYYDTLGRPAPPRPAIEPYAGEEVSLALIASSSHINVAIGKYEQRLPMHDHRYARLFAWADGHSYRLEVSGTTRHRDAAK
jgi:hypothetical protein